MYNTCACTPPMILQNQLFYKAFMILFNIKKCLRWNSIAKVDFGAIFKMAVIENQQYHILGHNYTSEAGRDKILMSIPRFLGTSNPMVASKNLYVCQPSWNPRWRPLLTHFWLFGDNFTYRTDRDKILMSIPRFSGTSNPMVASKKIYVCQPSL